jgi:tetratricopeptide (TPR) repeat protein
MTRAAWHASRLTRSKLLVVFVCLWACALSLSATPAHAAKKLWFGTDERIVHLQDLDIRNIRGPNGEALYLGHKYSYHAFLLPYHITDDGYVLVAKDRNAYLDLDDAKIKNFQARGALPSPLPAYQLPFLDYAFGYSLWGALLVIAAMIVLGILGAQRRKRALPLFEAATVHHRAGDIAAAIDGYTQAIEVDPKFAVAHNLRGNAFEASGEQGKAIADYTKAVKLDPKLAKAALDRAILREKTGRLDLALADYTAVIKLGKDPTVFVYRGCAHLGKGDFNRAIADFTAAINIDPNFAAAYHYRSMAYEETGQTERARSDQAKVNALAGNAPPLQQSDAR